MHPLKLCNFIPLQWMSVLFSWHQIFSWVVVKWRHIRIATLHIQGATSIAITPTQKILRAFILARSTT